MKSVFLANDGHWSRPASTQAFSVSHSSSHSPSVLVSYPLLLQAVPLHGLSVTWLFINSPCPSLSGCLDTQETGYQETEAGKTHRAGVEGSSQPGLSFGGVTVSHTEEQPCVVRRGRQVQNRVHTTARFHKTERVYFWFWKLDTKEWILISSGD